MKGGEMIGLIVLIFFIVYLLISILVTNKAIGWAKSRNHKPWLWGGLAAFMMYNLVFWDWIPTVIVHKYYCTTQSGFFVYKTPEQWEVENPDLTVENLKPLGIYKKEVLVNFPYQALKNDPQRKVQMINQRIYLDSNYQWNILNLFPIKINRLEYFIADSNDYRRLATLVDFSRGYGNPMTTGKGLYAWKFWLRGNCYGTHVDVEKVTGYKDYLQKIIKMGE